MQFSNIHQNTWLEYLLVQLDKQIYKQFPELLIKMTMKETGMKTKAVSNLPVVYKVAEDRLLQGKMVTS